LAVIELAIFWSRTVLPVRGGATISMRWPLPIGVTRSTIRMFNSLALASRMSRRLGCNGVRSSKFEVSMIRSGSSPLIASTRSSAK
jgi:hypothetical protein